MSAGLGGVLASNALAKWKITGAFPASLENPLLQFQGSFWTTVCSLPPGLATDSRLELIRNAPVTPSGSPVAPLPWVSK